MYFELTAAYQVTNTSATFATGTTCYASGVPNCANVLNYGLRYDTMAQFNYTEKMSYGGDYSARLQYATLNITGANGINNGPHPLVLDVYWEMGDELTLSTAPRDPSNYQFVTRFTTEYTFTQPATTFGPIDVSVPARYLIRRGRGMGSSATIVLHFFSTTDFMSDGGVTGPQQFKMSMGFLNDGSIQGSQYCHCLECVAACPLIGSWCGHQSGRCVEGTFQVGAIWFPPGTGVSWDACVLGMDPSPAAVIPASQSLFVNETLDTAPRSLSSPFFARTQIGINPRVDQQGESYIWFDDRSAIVRENRNISVVINIPSGSVRTAVNELGVPQTDWASTLRLYLLADAASADVDMTWETRAAGGCDVNLGAPTRILSSEVGNATGLYWDVTWFARYSTFPLVFRLSGENPEVGVSAPSGNALINRTRPLLVADARDPVYAPYNPSADIEWLNPLSCWQVCPVPLGNCFFNTTVFPHKCEEAFDTPYSYQLDNDTTILPADLYTLVEGTLDYPDHNLPFGIGAIHYLRFPINQTNLQPVDEAIFRIFRGQDSVGNDQTFRLVYWFNPPAGFDLENITFSSVFDNEHMLLGGRESPVPTLMQMTLDVTYAFRIAQLLGELWLAVAMEDTSQVFIPALVTSLPQAVPQIAVSYGSYADYGALDAANCTACMALNDPSSLFQVGWCAFSKQCIAGWGRQPWYTTCEAGWSLGGCPVDVLAAEAVMGDDNDVAYIAANTTFFIDTSLQTPISRELTGEYIAVSATDSYMYSFVQFALPPIPFEFDQAYLELSTLSRPDYPSSKYTSVWWQQNITVDVYEYAGPNLATVSLDALPDYQIRYIDSVDSCQPGQVIVGQDSTSRTYFRLPVTEAVVRAITDKTSVSFVLMPTLKSDYRKNRVLFYSGHSAMVPQFGPRLLLHRNTYYLDVCGEALTPTACLSLPVSCGWCDSTRDCRFGTPNGAYHPCPGIGAWGYDRSAFPYFSFDPLYSVIGEAIDAASMVQTYTPTLPVTVSGVYPFFYRPEAHALATNTSIWVVYAFNATDGEGNTASSATVLVPPSRGYPFPAGTYKGTNMCQTTVQYLSTFSRGDGVQYVTASLNCQGYVKGIHSWSLSTLPGITPDGIFATGVSMQIVDPWDQQWMSNNDYAWPRDRPHMVLNMSVANDPRYAPRTCSDYPDPCACIQAEGCGWCSNPGPRCGNRTDFVTIPCANDSALYRYVDECPAGAVGIYGVYVANLHVGLGNCTCALCANGTVPDNKRCTMCLDIMFSPEPTTQCKACAEGTYPVTDHSSCENCTMGYYSRGLPCAPCDPGHFQPLPGQRDCDLCPGGTYQVTAGLTYCDACVTGQDCVNNGTSTKALLAGYGGCCTGPIQACLPMEACKGGNCTCPDGNLCNTGYTGDYCEACDKNGAVPYRRLGQQCVPCPALAYLLVVAAVVAVALLCVLLLRFGRTLSRGTASLSIGLGFTQAVGMFQLFNFDLPAQVTSFIEALSVTNLSSNIINTECAFPKLSFLFGFVLRLALPVAVLLVFALMYAAVKLHAIWVARTVVEFRTNHQHFVRERDMKLRGCARLKDYLRWQAVRFRTKYKSSLELSQLKSKIVNAYITFLVLAYLFTSQTALEIFACDPTTGALASNLAQPCSGPLYDTLRGVSIAALTIYTAGLPVVFLIILLVNRTEARLGDEKFLARYGMLFSRYKGGRFMWELIIMVRKVATCVCAVFAPVLQPRFTTAVILIVVYALAMILQIIGKPYRLVQHNVLESTLLVVYSLALITATAAQSGNQSIKNWSLFVFFVAGVAAIVLCLLYDVVEAIRKRFTSSTSKGPSKLTRFCGGELDDAAFNVNDRANHDAAHPESAASSYGAPLDSDGMELNSMGSVNSTKRESLAGRALPAPPPSTGSVKSTNTSNPAFEE